MCEVNRVFFNYTVGPSDSWICQVNCVCRHYWVFLVCCLSFFSTVYSVFISVFVAFTSLSLSLLPAFLFWKSYDRLYSWHFYTHHISGTTFKLFISHPASINECNFRLTKQVSSVFIVTTYRLVQTNFSPLKRAQTQCGAHTTPDSMPTGCIFPPE